MQKAIKKNNEKRGRPSKLLYVTLLVTFFSSYFVFIEPAPFDIVIVALLLFLLVSKHIAFHPAIRFEALTLTALMIVSLVSVLESESEMMSFSIMYFSVTTYLSFMALALGCLVGKYGKYVYSPIMLGSTAAGVFTTTAVILAFMGAPIPGPSLLFAGDRGMGWFKDPNVLGPTLMMSTMYLYCILPEFKDPKKKLFLIGTFGFLVIGTILTYSRATIGATVFALVVYLFLTSIMQLNLPAAIKITRTVKFFSLAVTSLAICYLLIHLMGLDELFIKRAGMQRYDEDRFMTHSIVEQDIMFHPFGIGSGNTIAYMIKYYPEQGAYAVHQNYLKITFENGVLGGFFYIIFVIRLGFTGIMISIRKWPGYLLASSATALFLGYCLCGFVIDTMHWRCFWVVAGFILGLKILYFKYRETMRQQYLQQTGGKLRAPR